MNALPEVRVFDTLSGEKRLIEPIQPGKISMYVCGVTVYDLTHIGHARVFIFFDLVQRFLRQVGYDVTYVRNHTDVDDKIIKRANEVGEAPLELAQRFIEELDKDMAALHVHHADIEPKVSDHITQIITLVEGLVEKGFAYAVDGDVYYRVEKFDGYGKLSHRKLEDMEAGRSGRVEEQTSKEHPFDFALWKSAKEGDVSWDSPWGKGRPGWHIECSAMSGEYLGDTFDIHGGGRDLIFPHHENEIAQSEAAHGKTFANNWMHVGMVNVAETTEDGRQVERKMSKSLGNFWTTRDVLGGYHPDAIRYFMHTTHYRNPITYSVDNLEEARQRVTYFYETLQRIETALAKVDGIDESAPFASGTAETLEGFDARFNATLTDDFNTPKALAVIGEVAKIGNELTESKKKPNPSIAKTLAAVKANLAHAGAVLGILETPAAEALLALRDLRVKVLNLDVSAIESKIQDRESARAQKDWGAADGIRDELLQMGVEIMDAAEGTTWRVN